MGIRQLGQLPTGCNGDEAAIAFSGHVRYVAAVPEMPVETLTSAYCCPDSGLTPETPLTAATRMV